MKNATASLSAILLCAVPAAAAECDAVAADIIRDEGARLDRRTNSVVLLKHHLTSEMSVSCNGPPLGIDLFIASEGAFPPIAFFDLAGRAGQRATGLSAADIREAAIRCQRSALRSDTELATTVIGEVSVECQAFTRAGGATSFTIYKGSRGK